MILLLIGIWAYVLFFATPSQTDVTFTDLNFGETTDTSFPPSDNADTTTKPIIDVQGPERLRQLTTRPVAGYQDIQVSTSSTPYVRYVESGTGHIFSINLKTGEEKRISGTTIPVSRLAAITQNGRFVMMQSGSGAGAEFIVGELSSTSESISVDILAERVIDFTDSLTNTFLYAVQTSNTVVAKEYDPVKKVSKTLFTVPFREARLVWGGTATSTHYFYPKAATLLEGYGYQVVKGVIERLPADGFGFTLYGTTDGFVYSKQVDNTYRSFHYNKVTGESSASLMTYLGDKCAPLKNTTTSLVCGAADTTYDHQIPDLWYQGAISFSDDIWLVNIGDGFSEKLISISQESGRELDIQKLITSSDGNRVYFMNTADSTLWLLDRSI